MPPFAGQYARFAASSSPPLALVAMPLVTLVRQKAKEWSNKEGSGGGLGRFDDIRVGPKNEDQKTPRFVCGALLSGNGGGAGGANERNGGVALQVHSTCYCRYHHHHCFYCFPAPLLLQPFSQLFALLLVLLLLPLSR